jgi:hypothetical protein
MDPMNCTNQLILLLLMITSGCHKLHNKFNRIELECGSDANFGGSYMKFLQSENAEIQQAEENLRAFHVDEAAMQSSHTGQRIQVTSKGCVAIPKGETGRLDVFTRVPRQGISIHLEKSKTDLSRHQLLPIKESHFGFICPLEGYFAVDSLSVPLLLPSGPNSLSERNRIVAYDEATQSEVILFEKPFGESTTGELQLFNTSSLKPGEYLLKSTRELIDLRSETQLISSDLATCPLTIVETTPSIPAAILRLPESSIVPLGSKLSWTSDKHTDMKFCRRQGQGCSKPEDFHETSEVLNQDEGVWDYCFLLENRAGRRSGILCKEIRVSGTKPQIHIAINTPAISTDLPILDFPTTRLKYKVQTDHSLATKSDLQKSQMCRVEFSFHGQVNLATDTITCLSTECRDKSLKEFVPCGSELEIDISGLYKTDLINKAYLKLIVQADDGAGNVSTRENSVLIDKDRWEYVALTGPGSSLENEKFARLFPITDDRVQILTQSQKIFEYAPASQTWKEVLDLSQLVHGLDQGLQDLVVMPDRSIYGLFHNIFMEKPIVFKRDPGKPWAQLMEDQSPPACSDLSNDLAGNLYCQHEGQVYAYSEQNWKEINLSDSQGEKLCRGYLQIFAKAQSQWLFCGGALYSRQSGEAPWMPRTEFGEGLPGYVIEDKNGNIWLSSDEWSDEFFVGYFNPLGQWNDAVEGKILKFQTSTIGLLSLSSSGDAQYGSLVWDSSLDDWKPRYSFLNPLAFMPLNNVHKSLHDSFLLWDSSMVISVGRSDYLFTFPADRWNVRSLEALDYHSESQQFFSVAGYAGDSSSENQLVSIRKRQVMNWLPVVTDSQLYDEFQLARLNSGATYFIAGKKLIYRQNPVSGVFEVYRRFPDREDIITGVDGQLVAAYRSGQLSFDVGGGSFLEFKVPQQLELNSDPFVKDRQLWAMDAKSPGLHRISADGSVQSHGMPAECHGGSSTLLTHTASHLYTLGGANPCLASFEDLIFKPLNIPDYPFEAAPALLARLSMSRLALQATAEDNEFYIVDLEKQKLEGPFPLADDKLLTLQESPGSKQLFALYANRVDVFVNGSWVTHMTSDGLSAHLGRSDVELKSMAVDREDSILLATDAAPLLRLFLNPGSP